MDEFLAVAKSLEIKELWNESHEKTDEPKEEPLTSDTNDELKSDPLFDPEMYTKNFEEQTVISDQIKMRAPQESQRSAVSVSGRHECDQCNKTYSGRGELNRHKRIVHQGVTYACDQCDFQATQQSTLTVHIQSKHEGVKYACDHCDYQATKQSNLTQHTQSKHEGIQYNCDQCPFITSRKHMLNRHKSLNH